METDIREKKLFINFLEERGLKDSFESIFERLFGYSPNFDLYTNFTYFADPEDYVTIIVGFLSIENSKEDIFWSKINSEWKDTLEKFRQEHKNNPETTNVKYHFYDADSFDYRIMAREYMGGVIWFSVNTVYYKDGKPICYDEKPVSLFREPLEEMVSVINSVSESINKPIIWSDDRFPEEYKK